jgi:hypothetical protein
VNSRKGPSEAQNDRPATRHAQLRKSLATVGGIVVCLVIGAWFLLGLVFIWLSAALAGAVGAILGFAIVAIPPLALFLAWMKWGPWCDALRQFHCVCRRTVGAAS